MKQEDNDEPKPHGHPAQDAQHCRRAVCQLQKHAGHALRKAKIDHAFHKHGQADGLAKGLPVECHGARYHPPRQAVQP